MFVIGLLSILILGQITYSSEFDARNDFVSEESDDLALPFKSAPGLRPPRWNISTHHADLVTPGYWFTAPYTALRHLPHALEFQPGQIGPAIFDAQGELVWSGALQFSNRNIFDFKVVSTGIDGDIPALSLIYGPNHYRHQLPHGAGLLMDTSYRVVKQTEAPHSSVEFNKHEYVLLNGGKSALIITTIPTEAEGVRVYNNGFVEMDTETGEILFEWSPLNELRLAASYDEPPEQQPLQERQYQEYYAPADAKPLCGYRETEPWDWIHLNSVDKTTSGDYITSARATSTIYRISHIDGSIQWQLGGKNSSFVMDGFNFSHQHDARVRFENSTTTIVSIHNNAADDKGQTHQTSAWSSALVVSLDIPSMRATLLRQWDRPDHGLSLARGNVQILENSHAFVCWSDNGYISEFTDDGRLVLEARFASHRFTTYRAYKFNFTGHPTAPPDLVSEAYGTSVDTAVSMLYVSWNGATEVQSWNFYGSASNAPLSSFSFMGNAAKSGFETTFRFPGFAQYVYAEGIDKYGQSLGRSEISESAVKLPFESSIHPKDLPPLQSLLGLITLMMVIIVTLVAWIVRMHVKQKEHQYVRIANASAGYG